MKKCKFAQNLVAHRVVWTTINIAVMFCLSASEVFVTPAEFGLRQLTYHDQKLAILLFFFSDIFEVYF